MFTTQFFFHCIPCKGIFTDFFFFYLKTLCMRHNDLFCFFSEKQIFMVVVQINGNNAVESKTEDIWNTDICRSSFSDSVLRQSRVEQCQDEEIFFRLCPKHRGIHSFVGWTMVLFPVLSEFTSQLDDTKTVLK